MNMCHEWMSEVCGGGGESKWCQHAFGNHKPEETRGGVITFYMVSKPLKHMYYHPGY